MGSLWNQWGGESWYSIKKDNQGKSKIMFTANSQKTKPSKENLYKTPPPKGTPVPMVQIKKLSPNKHYKNKSKLRKTNTIRTNKINVPKHKIEIGDGNFHSVSKGDTLASIAKAYNIPLKELIAYNPQIKNPNKIYVNDRINLRSLDSFKKDIIKLLIEDKDTELNNLKESLLLVEDYNPTPEIKQPLYPTSADEYYLALYGKEVYDNYSNDAKNKLIKLYNYMSDTDKLNIFQGALVKKYNGGLLPKPNYFKKFRFGGIILKYKK